ncbi:plastocyanin/azurin family copper-binding protein [Roseibacillus persicicus]|uniref:plastocyanin/azurin family copper-binding protein n=1 Tax=Roseibacillus persicicus TaxID=454148 RepID=UPI00398BB104
MINASPFRAAAFGLALPALLVSLPAAELNIARKDVHPYVRSEGSRAEHRYSDAAVNSERVYDFYRRQAEYYLAMAPEEVPALLPAFPGLDRGEFGHWGKYNQNNYKNDDWNRMEVGTVVGAPLHASGVGALKGVNVRLGEEGLIAACFDPVTLSYPVIWDSSKQFLKINPFRWGLARGTQAGGRTLLHYKPAAYPGDTNLPVYRGYYRAGSEVVFDYDYEEKPVLDRPGTIVLGDEAGSVFTRTMSFPQGVPVSVFPLVQTPADCEVLEDGVYQKGTQTTLVTISGEIADAALTRDESGLVSLQLGEQKDAGLIRISIWSGANADLDLAKQTITETPLRVPNKSLEEKPQSPETITLKGELGDESGAYAIDTIPVPFENPYRSLMMFSGVAFYDDGTAAVSTLMGDIWTVSGLDADLSEVKWKRFATGIAIPFGLQIIDNELFVCGKQQITRLHDLDGNGEADFHENWSNKYLDDHGHPHIYGLEKDDEGNFYLIYEYAIARIDKDTREVEVIATGVRNCMGFGSTTLDDEFTILAAPQEGDWTPASMIIRPQQGGFYGFEPGRKKVDSVSLPLCYIPRGVDNSTGGFLTIKDERWGPLSDSVIGLSYGSGNHYRVLFDSGLHGQAATVPLPGDFPAGLVRAVTSPTDGQVYTVGTDGWGDYAMQSGCFGRIRYTGKAMVLPDSFQAVANGLHIRFNETLDATSVEELSNYFVQQWNYEYASRYGSPEFSVKEPGKLGHDRVEVASARLLEDGRTVFLEIPELAPVMQMHVYMKLKTAAGHEFKSDLFPTIIEFDEATRFEGMQEVPFKETTRLVARIKGANPPRTKGSLTPPDETWGDATRILIETKEGLQFTPNAFRARPGEKLAVTLRNPDVMPHNWVLTQVGTEKLVGEASFKMLNDPEAQAKSYLEDEQQKNVVAHTSVIDPSSEQTIYFEAPSEPGDYRYICTFPGHWQVMQGVMTVSE